MADDATIDSEISMTIASDDDGVDSRRRAVIGSDKSTNRIRQHLSSINVEPAILLLTMAIGCLITIMPLFTFWARCVKMYDDEMEKYDNDSAILYCSNSSAIDKIFSDRIAENISTWQIYLQLASCLPTIIAAPIIGAWSDASGGRKLPLLLTLFGLIFYILTQLISIITYDSILIYYWMMVGEFGFGLTGGYAAVFAAPFAIVIDDSRSQMHQTSSSVPLRIGIAAAAQAIGSTIGGIIASVCTTVFIGSTNDKSYLIGVFIALVLVLMTLVYTIVFVRETHRVNPIGIHDHQSSSHSKCYQVSMRWLRPPIDKFVDVIRVFVEPRIGWTRFCLNMTIMFVFVEFLALDNDLMFLLVKLPPFNWSDSLWANYSIFKSFLFSCGMIISPLLLARTRWLGNDSLLIMIGIASTAIASLILSVANSTKIVFASGSLALLAGGISPGFRCFLPRMVRKDQTARLFTAFSIVLTICPILSALIFNNIFNATIDFWPGFAFLIGAIFELLTFFGQMLIHFLMRPLWISERDGLTNHRDVVVIDDDDRRPLIDNDSTVTNSDSSLE